MTELKRHAPTIPVVDMGAANAASQITAAIAKACREDGFFYLTGHGIAPEKIAATFKAIKRFFGQPLEEKTNTIFAILIHISEGMSRFLRKTSEMEKRRIIRRALI